MIVISTPLSISSSVRDIERLLRESPPFRAGRMSIVRILRLELRLESHERIVPELIEPDPNRREPFRIDVVDAACALRPVGDQSRLLQDPEMLGNRRPAD